MGIWHHRVLSKPWKRGRHHLYTINEHYTLTKHSVQYVSHFGCTTVHVLQYYNKIVVLSAKLQNSLVICLLHKLMYDNPKKQALLYSAVLLHDQEMCTVSPLLNLNSYCVRTIQWL